MKKLLLFLLPLVVSAQVQNIPNTTFPAVRTLLNSNFSWLDANKSDIAHLHTGVYSPVGHTHLIADITGLNASGVVGMFGTCSSVQFLGGDGLCHTAPVVSIFGRSGIVTAQSNDYSFSQISGTVGATQLPLPGASTLGAVKSLAAVSHNFLTQIGTDGLPVAARPACADLSDAGTGCSATPAWIASIGFDGGGVALSTSDTSCIYVTAAVNMATVKLRSECAGGTSCTGSASVAVTTGTMASYISSGMAGIATAACTAALSTAYASSTACVVAIPAASVVCFAGSGFATSVRVKADAVGVYQ